MIKVFTTNKNGKIELSKEELKALLDEAYWDGYRAKANTYTYTSPGILRNLDPYYCSVSSSTNTVTLNSNDVSKGTSTVESSMEVKA